METLLLLTICLSTFVCNGQIKEDGVFIGKTFAEKELKIALSKQKQHNILDKGENIIKDKVVALQIAEPILFNIYGKKNILNQKPYEIYLIKNYWVIQGTLLEDSLGGTFIIIMDARNAKIIKISHGK